MIYQANMDSEPCSLEIFWKAPFSAKHAFTVLDLAVPLY